MTISGKDAPGCGPQTDPEVMQKCASSGRPDERKHVGNKGFPLIFDPRLIASLPEKASKNSASVLPFFPLFFLQAKNQ